MSRTVLERVAMVSALLVVTAFVWFWWTEIGYVRETLALMEG